MSIRIKKEYVMCVYNVMYVCNVMYKYNVLQIMNRILTSEFHEHRYVMRYVMKTESWM